MTEARWRRTLGRVVRVRRHSRGVGTWHRGSRCRWRSDGSRGKVVVMVVRVSVATVREGRLGHRLMQQDIRMPVGRWHATGGI